mgnify:CR=1 FL=1
MGPFPRCTPTCLLLGLRTSFNRLNDLGNPPDADHPMTRSLTLAAIAALALGLGACRPADRQDAAPRIGENELPAGALGNLDDGARRQVLAAMNAKGCGCGAASLAACRASGHPCPHSHRAFSQAIELARLGNDAAAILAALERAPTARTAPPAARGRAADAGHEGHDHSTGVHEVSGDPGNN